MERGRLWIYDGWLQVRPIVASSGVSPAADWFHCLDLTRQARVCASCAILEQSLRSGRPVGWRTALLSSRVQGLHVLRTVPPGAPADHDTILYLREDRVLWAATGVSRDVGVIDVDDIANAEEVVDSWLERRTA